MLTDDARRFLDAIFPDHKQHAIFAWLAGPKTMRHARDLDHLDQSRDCYWSIAAFKAEAVTNDQSGALEVRVLVIDDVGDAPQSKVSEGAVELALGVPTAKVISSPGNYQWAYRLSRPVAVADWAGFWAGAKMLIGAAKLDGKSAVHIFRLPMGVNTKPDYGGAFPVQLVELNPGIELDPDSIPPAAVAAAAVVGPEETRRVHNIRGMMAVLPNEIEYDDWVAVGERILAIAVDAEAGREAFHEFSARAEHKDYDEAYTEGRWRSFTADRTRGGLLVKAVRAIGGKAVDDWWQSEAGPVFDDGAEPPEVPPGRGRVKFILGEKKQILSLMENAARGITGLGIACAYDEFHHRVFIQRPDGRSERLTDNAVLLLRVELNEAYGKDFGAVHIGDAVTALALTNGFNPVTDMLAEAEAAWDGVGRLDRLGPDYFHAPDTDLARRCFRKTMIAAVRRARRPGCKFDQILVTESPEGWDKSSAWAVLAGEENFSDADILGKDARAVQEELADVWVHEIADLSGLTRAEVEHVKAFASRTNDRARPAYGRHLLDQPRQSVEVGTTNAEAYLISSTGNRRFWPFSLSRPVDLKRLRADRLQIWGEAARAESGGETLVLDEKLWVAAGEEQEKRRVVDVWEDELENLAEVPIGGSGAQGGERIEVVHGEHFISSLSVVWYLERHRGYALNASSGRRIAEVMRKLGWERVQIRVDGQKMRGYKRPRPATVPPGNTVSGTKNIF